MSHVEQQDLPLFPLRTVLYPGGELSLRIFEPRYIELVTQSIRNGQGFGICPILNGNEAGTPATTYDVGTLATITDWDQGKDGLLSIVVEGSRRFHLHGRRINERGLLVGSVSWFEASGKFTLDSRHQYLSELLHGLSELVPIAPTQSGNQLSAAESLVYRLTERLPLALEQQTALLKLPSLAAQLEFCEERVAHLIKQSNTKLH